MAHLFDPLTIRDLEFATRAFVSPMIRPDNALRDAIDEIMERLRADGTIERIYRRYGVILQSPK